MESTLSRDIKRKFKNDVFTNLIKEDIERYGKCMHSINSAYIGIEWALKQSDEIKNLMENNDFEAMYNESERIYNEEYSTGEFCHEQSFKWGFQEGFDYAMKTLKKE